MHFFVGFLRYSVLTIGWIFWYCFGMKYSFYKNSTISFILLKNPKWHKMCLFLCKTNWRPLQKEDDTVELNYSLSYQEIDWYALKVTPVYE